MARAGASRPRRSSAGDGSSPRVRARRPGRARRGSRPPARRRSPLPTRRAPERCRGSGRGRTRRGSPARCGRRPPRRRPHARGSGRCADGGSRGSAARAPTPPARRATASACSGSSPSALSTRSCGRALRALSTQPAGDGTLIPSPLSSHTKRIGSGRRWCAQCAAVLSAACAVAWLTEASPKLQTTTESAGQRHPTPTRAARSIANAIPTALGGCDAIVEVCGMTARSAFPNTLCRPPGSARPWRPPCRAGCP